MGERQELSHLQEEATKRASKGGIRSEDTDRSLEHQKFISVLQMSRPDKKKRLEHSLISFLRTKNYPHF